MAKEIKAKVLLLEDDLDLQELIRDYFEPRGYEIICHAQAEDGVKEIIQQSMAEKPIDLVITDYRLPNMNGSELIDQLKRVAPQIPIIVMTAHGNLDLAVEVIEKGAYDFVVKPLQFAQLSMSMERAVYFSRLQIENQKLKTAMSANASSSASMVARSTAMKSIMDLGKRVAKSDATVLIRGESGTGKEVLAQFIHANSPRAAKTFVAINCSAIPASLLESELFGHVKGSFTGASDTKIGLFEEANGGTLFLDEIGDLSLPLQAKLLRVIQERKIKRVGENTYRDIDVRLLAATHKDLDLEVREKRFREDLFFRLNVIPMKIAPLRERREDILPLAEHFLRQHMANSPTECRGFSKKAMQYMLKGDWAGNVRELENAIERAVVLCDSAWIEEKDFLLTPEGGEVAPEAYNQTQLDQLLEGYESSAAPLPEKKTDGKTDATPGKDDSSVPLGASMFPLLGKDELIPLETLELRYIEHVLKCVNGVKERAARILEMDRKTLYRKLEAIQNLKQ